MNPEELSVAGTAEGVRTSAGVAGRQRRSTVAAALLPAAVNILAQPVSAAGRLAWLCPILALPVGLLLCPVYRRAGETLRETGGAARGVKVLARLLYLLWGVFLLWGSAARFGGRMLKTLAESPQGAAASVVGGAALRLWLVLSLTWAVSVYLARRQEALARAGQIFFLAVAVFLAAVLALALPGLKWHNLAPVDRGEVSGLALGAGWTLSLSGYAAFGLLLPQEGSSKGGFKMCGWACGALAALLLALVGAFGPALILRMDEPFLYLLGGVGLPGAFQRGEAMLGTLAALGDLTLLALLCHGCGRLWRRLAPGAPAAGGWALCAVGFALAALAPQAGAELLTGSVGLWGNLILGAAIPVGMVLVRKVPKGK